MRENILCLLLLLRKQFSAVLFYKKNAKSKAVWRTAGPRTFCVFKKISPSRIETGKRITELTIACCGFNPNAKTR